MTDCGEVMLEIAEALRGAYGREAQAKAMGAAADAACIIAWHREGKALKPRTMFRVIEGGKK